MLKNPQLLPKLSIDEEPNKLLEKYAHMSDFANSRTGIADKVLADKELEREKRRRSESVSTYSSSGSASTYSSDNEEEDEEGGDRKRVRRNSPSRSPSSYSSSYSSSEDSGSESPRGRTRVRQTRSVSSGSADRRSTSRGNERQGQPLRHGTPPTLHSPSRTTPERDLSGGRRSRSPDNPPPKPTRSRWDQRGRSPPPRRERSLSPYSKRKLLAG
jgi:hypothetical protein